MLKLGADDFLTKPFRARALSGATRVRDLQASQRPVEGATDRQGPGFHARPFYSSIMKPPDSQTPLRIAMVDVYVLRPSPGGARGTGPPPCRGRPLARQLGVHSRTHRPERDPGAGRATRAGRRSRLRNAAALQPEPGRSLLLPPPGLRRAHTRLRGRSLDADAEFGLSEEHDAGEWLLVRQAQERVSWPRLRPGPGRCRGAGRPGRGRAAG